MKNEFDFYVTGPKLSRILGISDRQVRNLANEGIVSKKERGKYDLRESVQGYINHIKLNKNISESNSNSEYDKDFESARLKHMQANKAELIYLEMKGELHRGNDIEHIMKNMLMNFKNKLIVIPNTVAGTIAVIDDENEIVNILVSRIQDALEELYIYDAKMFRSNLYVDIEDDIEDDDEN